MQRFRTLTLALICAVLSVNQGSANDPPETMIESEQVLNELMSIPARQIPHRLLEEAHGIVIVPNVIKIGFIAGARRGHGVVMVRDAEGEWTLPQFVTLTGGSVGWQAGIQGTDVVLVFTTPKGVEGLMRGKFTVGVDASATAGPVGREAALGTDATLQSETYSYSRSRGLFVGVSLDGSALEIDHEAHQFYYGMPSGELPRRVPPAASHLRHFLTEIAPHRGDRQVPVDRNAPGISPRQLEAIRRSLIESSARLQMILSPEWKVYLAMPAELSVVGGHVHPDVFAITRQRYEHVAKSASYLQLTERPEFQNTYELLREFEKAMMQPRAMLHLPPPPLVPTPDR